MVNRTRNVALEAFTRIELLVVLATIAIVAAVVLSAVGRAKQKARRIQCTDNLKQLGLGFRTFAIDGDSGFSALAPTNREAGPRRILSGGALRYFQLMSNGIGNPKLLVCPADTRMPAKDFGLGFSNTNISYFVGVDAVETYPQMFLGGDRNLTNGLPVLEGILLLVPDRPIGWTSELHNRQGNVALADGSVQGFSRSRPREAVVGITNRLAMPSIP